MGAFQVASTALCPRKERRGAQKAEKATLFDKKNAHRLFSGTEGHFWEQAASFQSISN